MDKVTEKYFKLAYDLLSHWLLPTYEQFMYRYQLFPEECSVEEINGYQYLIFVYPLISEDKEELLEQGIVLVFDGDKVIADNAFMHASMNDVMHNERVYDEITTDSDWSYLQHYTLCNMMFPNILYPCCKSNNQDTFLGETCFFTNAYVTKRYRKQHIFTNMLEITKEMILRNCMEDTIYYSVFSLDPDIACYGEDTPKEPYVYSMKDEEDRMRNKQILEKYGYMAVKLEETEPNTDSDGTKLWFAVCKENEHIMFSYDS